MKIGKIENQGDIFKVQFIPNRVEKFFGKKEHYKEVKRIRDELFLFGMGGVYLFKNGKEVDNLSKLQKALDQYRKVDSRP
jgi:hypothetical protein